MRVSVLSLCKGFSMRIPEKFQTHCEHFGASEGEWFLKTLFIYNAKQIGIGANSPEK